MVEPLLTRSQLEIELTDDQVRATRMIFFSMAASIVMFAAVVIWYALTEEEAESDTGEVRGIDILTMAVIVVFVLLTSLGNAIVSTAFSVKRIMDRVSEQAGMGSAVSTIRSPAQRLISAVRTRSIVRLAFYEAAALFGLIVAFLMALQGRLVFDGASVIYFLPAVSAILYIFRGLPNRERILNECESILQGR